MDLRRTGGTRQTHALDTEPAAGHLEAVAIPDDPSEVAGSNRFNAGNHHLKIQSLHFSLLATRRILTSSRNVAAHRSQRSASHPVLDRCIVCFGRAFSAFRAPPTIPLPITRRFAGKSTTRWVNLLEYG